VTSNPEEILLRANTLFRAEQSLDLRENIAEKIQELRHYDILGMDRVAAILMLGRSGSLLLASYFDGHEDVIMLAEDRSQLLYQFFERYQSLSWGDRLLGYAAFDTVYPRFFDGDFGISRVEYYAAVQAILEFYAGWPLEFLESRRAFFIFIHIAYTVALGRRPVSARPMIVYAQHVWDNGLASQLVEDFPQAKFIHTIRDPISSCDGVFHYHLQFVERHIQLPFTAVFLLTAGDRPHLGMESRTWTVRFEDLHSDLSETMRALSDWLGLPFRPILVDSTFNGIRWVVTRDGETWSGARLEQAQRHSWDLSRKDRALLFALFYENFIAWNYPCPRALRRPTVRYAVALSLFLVPFKMEVTAARAVFQRLTLPLVRNGNLWRAMKSLLAIGFCRLKIIRLSVSLLFRRRAYGTTLVDIDHAGYFKRGPAW
jgi:Sulfotransferase family